MREQENGDCLSTEEAAGSPFPRRGAKRLRLCKYAFETHNCKLGFHAGPAPSWLARGPEDVAGKGILRRWRVRDQCCNPWPGAYLGAWLVPGWLTSPALRRGRTGSRLAAVPLSPATTAQRASMLGRRSTPERGPSRSGLIQSHRDASSSEGGICLDTEKSGR
jgi:hypothetical protein